MTLEEFRAEFARSVDPARRMDLLEMLMTSSLPAWDPAAEELARVLAEDPNSVVRHEAAFALGELRGAGRISEGVGVDELCHAALNDRSLVVRHEATEALYGYPAQIAQETLHELLSDHSEEIRETAAISLTWRRDRDTPQ